jgi:hypothetical protein
LIFRRTDGVDQIQCLELEDRPDVERQFACPCCLRPFAMKIYWGDDGTTTIVLEELTGASRDGDVS